MSESGDVAAVEQKRIRQYRATGREIPAEILNKPKLLPGLDIFMVAFVRLSGERNAGMAIGEIPWFSIKRYALINRMSESQSDDLEYFINKMDHAYLVYYEKKNGGK